MQSKLSFDINLDEDYDAISRLTIRSDKSRKVEKKTETKEQKKKVIPKKFIAHILELGFAAKDAARLYQSKNDWLGMRSGGQVFCSETGCSFSTPLSSDCMFEHCRTVHGWRDYPCSHDNCEFIAYSKRSFKTHLAMFHSPYKKYSSDYFSCQRVNCKASFSQISNLVDHQRVHDNVVFRCVFCPYGNSRGYALTCHQRMHFNTREFVCAVCQKTFTTLGQLEGHVQVHDMDEEESQCPLCDRRAVRRKLKVHLRDMHKVRGITWDYKKKQYIVPEQI